MSYVELEHHKKYECPNTIFKCTRCSQKLPRRQIEVAHTEYDCIHHLQGQVKELKKIKDENQTLETELE